MKLVILFLYRVFLGRILDLIDGVSTKIDTFLQKVCTIKLLGSGPGFTKNLKSVLLT
jgi:hypothetical protein